MTARILPPEEYPRLAGTELEAVWPTMPSEARVVVVEHDGQIVGCHALMPFWHVECLWIAPEHRGKSSVARRLWMRVQQEAKALGQGAVITAAMDDTVRGLLEHVGAQQLPGDHYVVPMRG